MFLDAGAAFCNFLLVSVSGCFIANSSIGLRLEEGSAVVRYIKETENRGVGVVGWVWIF